MRTIGSYCSERIQADIQEQDHAADDLCFALCAVADPG